MATKLIELELSEKIIPIPTDASYTDYRILVRFQKQPIGWIWLPGTNEDYLTTEELHKALKEQLSLDIFQQALKKRFGFEKEDSVFPQPISIVVCTRNRTKLLASCLEALLSLDYPTYEIIVVDNAPSNNDTYQLVVNLPVRYAREDRPGLDWARNRGIAEAQYPIVAFTDDDALVDRYWLQAIANTFNNSKVMAVTGYVAPAVLDTPAQKLFEFSYGGMGHGLRRKIISRQGMTDRHLIWASNFGVGANMSFRREVFDKIGLFDPALDVGTPSCGGGDIEMFHRLVAQGHMLVYEPNMLIWHKHREQIPALRKQIYDNGRSFGCYLMTCYRHRSVSLFSIVKFLLVNYLSFWILKNLIHPPRQLPRYMPIIELYGMLTSPFAYRASQIRAKEIAANNPPS